MALGAAGNSEMHPSAIAIFGTEAAAARAADAAKSIGNWRVEPRDVGSGFYVVTQEGEFLEHLTKTDAFDIASRLGLSQSEITDWLGEPAPTWRIAISGRRRTSYRFGGYDREEALELRRRADRSCELTEPRPVVRLQRLDADRWVSADSPPPAYSDRGNT